MSLILETQPTYKWNSLWRPIEYVFHHYDVDFTAVASNGGNAKLTHNAHSYSGQAGKYVYVNGVVYQGMFLILTVDDATHITIDAPYISTDTGEVGLISTVTNISLVAGYPSTHSFYASNPQRTVCIARSQADPSDGKVHIRIEQYLQSIFEIHPPTEGFDYWMSTPFFLAAEAAPTTPLDSIQRYAINSAITTASLQGYTVPGEILAPNGFIDYGDSCYLISQIVNDAVYNTKTCDSVGNYASIGVGSMTILNPFTIH